MTITVYLPASPVLQAVFVILLAIVIVAIVRGVLDIWP